MAPEPPPGSTGGAMYQRCVVLGDWWLERVDGKEGKVRVAGISYTPKMRKGAARAFRSNAIRRRHDHNAIETEDGRQIQIRRLLNMTRTRDNGFSEEVCKSFEYGFPVKWLEILNPNTEQRNAEAQSQSEPTANVPRHSVEYYMEKISSEISTKPLSHAFLESYFCSSTGYTSNTDSNAGNMDASGGFYGGGTNMPEKPLTPPRETCSSGQESDQHKSTQIDASEQGIDNRSINQSTGSICHNSKVDDSILASSNVVSVEKVGHRSSVGCSQAEEDAGIQHENMQSCSSEQELVTHPIDSATVNENLNSASSDLGEPGTQKCGKVSVNLGATNASELPMEKMNQQFGPVRGSEDSTVRRLRSGKVFGTPSSGPMKRGHKQKKIQHEASDQNMVPNEGDTSTADLTSHENDSSAAGVITEDKQESHVSRRRGRPPKKRKRKSESSTVFIPSPPLTCPIPKRGENPIEMQPAQTPNLPWGSNRRREMLPPVLSPSFSRRPFPVTAATQDADVSEHPCVTLLEWWLARMEGDDQKIAVAGIFERNQTTNEFGPARIAKRHESCVLESEAGIVLCICGSLNISRTLAYGYSIQVCEKFMIGFPYWWENCNQLYPKETSSHGGRSPSFSSGRNSNVDSTKFYLEQFQLGERLHSCGSAMLSKLSSVKSSSNNDAAFQKSSHLPNGAPRFEEYTSDDNIAINENVAASNGDGERHEAACNEVYSVDIHLKAGRALGERDDDIATDASLVLTVDVANDASNEGADNATPTSTCDQRKVQHVALSEKAAVNEDVPTWVCLDVENSYLPSGTPRFEEYTCDGDIAIIENAAALNGDGERDEAVCNEVDNVETVLTSAVECANDANNEEADNAPSTNVQNSSDLSKETTRFEKNTYVGDIPTNGDAASSNDNSERCTAVCKEVDSIETSLVVDSTIRERGHDGIPNVSLSPTVECSNDAVSEGVHNNSLLGRKQTPVASLKSQGCQKRHQHTPSNEKPSGLPKKRRSELEKLQRPRSSPLTSPVPYAHVSPLTRDSAASLSMSTPEALKLKKTRSGRVVVPALNSGCQRIVYDKDGMVTGVVGLGSPSPKGSKLKGSATKKRAEPAAASKLKTSPRKKRSAEPAAASKLKTYARKKRRAE